MKNNIAINYALAASAAALFVGLTVWLIRGEGERTRESIHEAAHDAAKQVGSEVRDGFLDGADHAVDRAAEAANGRGSAAKQALNETGKISRDILGGVKDVLQPSDKAKTEGPTSAPPEEVKPGAPPVADPARENQDSPQSDPPSAPSEGNTPSGPEPIAKSESRKNSSPDDPIANLFELGHEVTKAADELGQDVLALSWDEEKKVGAEVHRNVSRDCTLLRPPKVIQRLQMLARPIADQRSRKELIFTFDVIKSDEVNAFSHAGGYIYVTSGMLDLFKSDAELQFFLAHEIAHQELKHVVKRMTYAARASQLGGQAAATLAQMAYLTIALGYSKEQEFDADAWAFRAMLHADRSRDEALAGMRQILAYVNKKEMEPKQSAARTPAEKTVQQIENHFKSHPPTAERLKRLEAIQP